MTSALAPAFPQPSTWLSRPIAAGRSGRRLAKTAIFWAEVLSSLRSGFGVVDTGAPLDLWRRVHRMRWIAENVCALNGIAVRMHGEVPGGPAILVANHLGYLDPLAIASCVACVPLAKREVARWPFFGESLRRLGAIFVQRGDAHDGARALLRMRTCLELDVPVLVFPEGTTSTGETVRPLLRGAFGLAARLGVPIVPMAIRYDEPQLAWIDDQLFVPHFVRTTARQSSLVEIEVGDPIHAGRTDAPEEIAETVRAWIELVLQETTQ